MDTTLVMDQVTNAASAAMQTANTFLMRVAAIDLPIPDAALVIGFALLACAIMLSSRGTAERIRSEIVEQYQAELLTANRRAQQARADLRKAELEVERERQKRRHDRLSDERAMRKKTTTLKVV